MRPMILLTPLLVLTALWPQPPQYAPGGAATAFTVTSPAFSAGNEIPKQYTCRGSDASPPLNWRGSPSRTASFALIMDDPDAPSGTFVHWVMWNLPASAFSLPEGVPQSPQLDNGAQQGRNGFRKIGYGGPCPPGGSTHRYFFRLYALDKILNLSANADRSDLDAAMSGHVLSQVELMGTFRR